MKKTIYLFLIFLAPVFLLGQAIVAHQGISVTRMDVSSAVTVGQVTLSPATAGKVIVRFDGTCIASPGDRIVLAASNTTSWGVNDGNVGVEAVDNDVNRHSFSHTRVYEVSAGTQTFYAIAHNYVETEGNGEASIYGSLTAEFIPNETSSLVAHQGISVTRIDVSNEVTVGQVSLNPTKAGKVIVRFDGQCISSPGDRIVLAASNTPSWAVNDGNVGVEAANSDVNANSFSHTRVYDVSAGSQTFYAVAHNYVETDGDGEASIYGTLTAEFIPNETSAIVVHQGISQTRIDVTEELTVGEITINPTRAGKVIVNFDGQCVSSPGDRIVLAASNTPSWGVNDGSIGLEAVDNDINGNSFSHTRVYDVSAGSQTFYAVAHNYVETDGNGEASIYGTLTVQFVPDETVGIADFVENQAFTFYPNPTTGRVSISKEGMNLSDAYQVNVMDSYGRMLQVIQMGTFGSESIDLSAYPEGIYILQLVDEQKAISAEIKVIKVNE